VPVLEVRNLSKRFGSITAVNDVSFTIGAGETVGLLGPNGAGKTTTVSMICGLIEPDSGEVRFQDQPIRGDTNPTRRLLGLVPQELALYDKLTALENLELFGALYDLKGPALKSAIQASLDLVELADRGHDAVKNYSGGMKRRLNLAAALLHDPQILLLDEPTVGVDPQSRNAIFENLEALKARGKSLLYTTHYMEEAERLCDRIVIMDKGRVVADDTLRGLHRRLPAANRLVVELEERAGDFAWVDEVRGLPGVANAAVNEGVLRVDMEDLAHTTPRVLTWLSEQRRPFSHVTSERPDLESVFLTLTGRSLRDS
jgi:ABC-2 type transport system ATP-binding protein